MQSYNPAVPGCTISYWMVAKHVNKKNAGKTSVLAIKGAVSRNSAKLGNYKMPVKLRET